MFSAMVRAMAYRERSVARSKLREGQTKGRSSRFLSPSVATEFPAPWRCRRHRIIIDAVFDVSDVRIHSMDVRTCPRCSLRLTHRPNRLRQMHLARFQKTQPSSQSLMATSVSESLNALVESCHAATSLSQLIYVECNWMN